MKNPAEDILKLAADMHDFGIYDKLEQIIEEESSDTLNEDDLEFVSAARAEEIPPFEEFRKKLKPRN